MKECPGSIVLIRRKTRGLQSAVKKPGSKLETLLLSREFLIVSIMYLIVQKKLVRAAISPANLCILPSIPCLVLFSAICVDSLSGKR